MHKKHSILVLSLLVFGLLSFYAGNLVSSSSEESESVDDLMENIVERVGKLEIRVTALQEQIKELASKPRTRVLTIPGTTSFPGKNIPPGATEHEINGMKYWLIPLNEGN